MRRLFTTLLLLILIAAVIIYFLPGTIHLEKTMTLKAQQEVVFNYINTTGEWKKWAAWLTEDPVNTITYNGPVDGSGASLNWSSEVPDLSTGNVLLESSQPITQVKAAITFTRYGTSENTYLLENTGNGTKITWTADLNVAEKGFPVGWVNKVKALFWKNKINTFLDASLKNLDEATMNAVYSPGRPADLLSNKLDTIIKKVDSLSQAKYGKDTVYVDTLPKKKQ